jgi:hypothetical protein
MKSFLLNPGILAGVMALRLRMIMGGRLDRLSVSRSPTHRHKDAAILRTRSPFAAALGDVALKSRARWNQFLDIDSQSIIISAVAYKAACAPTKDGRRPMLLS